MVNAGLRWRSEAKPFENQARDGARRSEAKSSVGEEIEPPAGTPAGLILENCGQGELERFGADSQLKRGFVGSILSIFPVLKGKREILSGIPGHFADLERIRADKGILFRNREWEWRQSV